MQGVSIARHVPDDFPVGYYRIHSNVGLNIQMNRWLNWIGADSASALAEMRAARIQYPRAERRRRCAIVCAERWFPAALWLRDAGYHVVVFDGPGQGGAREQYGLSLTAQWGKTGRSGPRLLRARCRDPTWVFTQRCLFALARLLL